MKTAISLPDGLFDEADAVAVQRGASRSHLYATALAEYLARLRDADVTARLDAEHSHTLHERDETAHRAARRSVSRAEW